MNIIGHGQLRHQFWGEYSATIIVKFDTAAQAESARVLALNLFTRTELEQGSVLLFSGGGAELKHAEAQLRAAGADMHKVTSLKYSIDYGEPFTVHIRPEACNDGSVQQNLFNQEDK